MVLGFLVIGWYYVVGVQKNINSSKKFKPLILRSPSKIKKDLWVSLFLLLLEKLLPSFFFKSWPSTLSQSCCANFISLAPVQLKALPCVSWTWPPSRVHVVITTCSLVVTGWMSDWGRPSGWNSFVFQDVMLCFKLIPWIIYTATISVYLWVSSVSFSMWFQIYHELWVVVSCLLVPPPPKNNMDFIIKMIISRDWKKFSVIPHL